MLATLSGACGGGSEGACEVDETYDPTIDPASFRTTVDNPLFPLVPGTELTYVNGDETIVFTVTSDTKTILGVTTTVVHDVASVSGDVIEDTYDWYAQDLDGNVWYFGEDTSELENGMVVSKAGSWEAGVDGARPGIIIPAVPMVGTIYRQEYYACEAEDMGEILALSESVTVPAGQFMGCLKTHDFTPLDPAINEEKYYCPGVGFVLAVDVTSGDREELTTIAVP